MSSVARWTIVASLLATAAISACFDPTYHEPSCSPTGACPSGYSCFEGTCSPPRVETLRWVISEISIPRSNQTANDWGLDLNGDGTTDNRLGEVFAAFTSQGLSFEEELNQAIGRGEQILLASAVEFRGGLGSFATYVARDSIPAPCASASDTVCGAHLQGTGSFDVLASAAAAPLKGSVRSGVLRAGPGYLPLWLERAPRDAPFPIGLHFARVMLNMSSGGFSSNIIAGAIPVAELETQFVSPLLRYATHAVGRDCVSTIPPDCACENPSRGRAMLNLFDTSPKDCVITEDEIANSVLLSSLLSPDLVNGGEEMLSFGFAVKLAEAAFMP